jgi:transcriptional regulator with XRE-family HTH domain
MYICLAKQLHMESIARYKNWNAVSDTALAAFIGQFIRSKRMEQNITQAQLAKDAGISRSTLVLLEKGETASLNTLLQVLRILNQLHVLSAFEITPVVSPLLLAKEEMKKRQRVRTKPSSQPPKTDW